MTLFKQINSLLLGLFLVIMLSLVFFQFTETKSFMKDQMGSDLANVSTSLSLMLKPHLETGDTVMVETLVNVIFEGGFYKRVELTWLADNKKQVWENDVTIEGVPQWFINLDLFETQYTETTINSGWLQLATLRIDSNPGIGYQELWRIMSDTLIVLSILFLISLVVLQIRLKRILKPLHEVAVHAKDIAERKFHPDMALPSTTELSEVVGAINSMSSQLKLVFNALDNEVDTLKKDKLCDPVSQLPNRLYLTGQLNSWLDTPDFGGLLLANFEWIEDIHNRFGFQVRDETIRLLAKNLQATLPQLNETVIARISNTEFAFLILQADKEQITVYLQALIRVINQEILNAGCEANSRFSIGVVERQDPVNRVEFLSQADNALQHAINNNKVSHWFHLDMQQDMSREQWRALLTTAMKDKEFIFQWQPIHHTLTGGVMHREIYCRLKINNKIERAGVFMPYIARLGLGSELDENLLECIALDKLLMRQKEPIAINLSRESLVSLEFHQWLKHYLARSTNPGQLHFELPEAGITANISVCRELCDVITQGGAQFGIDNCGRQMGSLSYLQQLKPYYIKLDLSLSCYDSQEQEHNQQNFELCRALVNIARGLNIKVILTGIENNDHLVAIKSLRADGYQGYISSPVDVR
ncbi:cyclic-di-GMP regulatory protein [Psychromonas sp. CNPT3]|uniref:bifunctional diguanylate cyclase/phosphodiesterase n=1 Tax=Psychromonas sp. CNPT3 TaxID=314282 RepID=UPI00006E5684|nr:EAL domain-containing protein [Psychromonas sp. CNPT3]AGH80839.1 cyclic-di-GMP regulatory protein [Psychromonas sp. CNPT3]